MRQGKKVKKQFLVNFQANRMGQKVKEILKKQNKGGKTGTLKSRKKTLSGKVPSNGKEKSKGNAQGEIW